MYVQITTQSGKIILVTYKPSIEGPIWSPSVLSVGEARARSLTGIENGPELSKNPRPIAGVKSMLVKVIGAIGLVGTPAPGTNVAGIVNTKWQSWLTGLYGQWRV